MASKSETGHAKNAANFETFIDVVTSFGTLYAPSKVSQKLPALQTQLLAVKDSMDKFKTATTTYKNASNDREVLFKPLDKLAVRIVNTLKGADVLPQKIDDVKFYVDKLRSGRSKSKIEAAPEGSGEEPVEVGGTKTKSTSQLSYDSKVEHFENIVKILLTEPLYAPNEADLKLTALTTLLTDLKAKNKAANLADTNLNNARKVRNKALYSKKTGVYMTVQGIKAYIVGATHKKSVEYKQLVALKFSDMDIEE